MIANMLRARTTSGAMPRLLLVEDDRDIRDALAELFQDAGYLVRTAASVCEATELLRHERFALVVSDYSLPDGTASAILAPSWLGSTPALVITAHPRPEGIAGFTVVKKPLDPDRLLEIAARILTRRASSVVPRRPSVAPIAGTHSSGIHRALRPRTPSMTGTNGSG